MHIRRVLEPNPRLEPPQLPCLGGAEGAGVRGAERRIWLARGVGGGGEGGVALEPDGEHPEVHCPLPWRRGAGGHPQRRPHLAILPAEPAAPQIADETVVPFRSCIFVVCQDRKLILCSKWR
jgi:hypothetical protein